MNSKINLNYIIKKYNVIGRLFVICQESCPRFFKDIKRIEKLLDPAAYLYDKLALNVSAEGLEGINRFKTVSEYMIRLRLGELTPDIPRPTIDRKHILKFWSLYKRCPKHHDWDIFFLSVMNLHRIYILQRDFNIDSVVSPYTGKSIFSWEIMKLLRDTWVTSMLISQRSKERKGKKSWSYQDNSYKCKELNWYVSMKAGPNGRPAFKQWIKDWLAETKWDSVHLGLYLWYKSHTYSNQEQVDSLVQRLEGWKLRKYPSFNKSKKLVLWIQVLYLVLKVLNVLYSFLPWPFSKLISSVKKNISEYLEDFLADKDLTDLYHTRVARKLEPSGKLRLFAMGSIYTQTLIKPIANHCSKLLSKFFPDLDGTYDQMKSVLYIKDLLKNNENDSKVYSIDIKSATDRFVCLYISFCLWALGIFTIPESVMWWLLLGRRSVVYKRDDKSYTKPFYYSVGTPIGVLSSWTSLSMSHHVIVQTAYYRWYWLSHNNIPPTHFKIYSILGDDVVIAHEGTALEYLKILEILGIEVSKHKCYTSSKVAEFSKFIIKKDKLLKPIPISLVRHHPDIESSVCNSISLYEYLSSVGLSINSKEFTFLFPRKARTFVYNAFRFLRKPELVVYDNESYSHKLYEDWWAYLVAQSINYFSKDKTFEKYITDWYSTDVDEGIFMDVSPLYLIRKKNESKYPLVYTPRYLPWDIRFREEVLIVPHSGPKAVSGRGFVTWTSQVRLLVSLEHLMSRAQENVVPGYKEEVEKHRFIAFHSTKFWKKAWNRKDGSNWRELHYSVQRHYKFSVSKVFGNWKIPVSRTGSLGSKLG